MKKLLPILTLAIALLLSATISAQAEDENTVIDGKTQLMLIDSISAALNQTYIFEDVAHKMGEFIHEQHQKGIYKDLTNPDEFGRMLTEDMRSISHDLHLGVRFASDEQIHFACTAEPTDEDIEAYREEAAYNNFGFRKAERIKGNIGYLRFDGFTNTDLAGQTAIAAMNFLGYVDALIIDLRYNGGGSPTMIQLLSSYLFDDSRHLNSFYIRDGDITEQYWTQQYVSGPKLLDADVYVLTSNNTFSAAEEFTYNLKNMKRATIIGETTGGGAHPVQSRCFEGLPFILRLPYGRAINPISGTNWEGTGVEPDIKVAADDAFEVAQMEAMKNLMDKTTDEQQKASLLFNFKIMKTLKEPVKLSEKLMKSYVGSYEDRSIKFENGELIYQRGENPPHKMYPASETTFCFDDLDFFILEVIRDSKGTPLKLVGHYEGGRTDESPRTSGK